jgi:monoamine oxidase
VLSGYGPEGNSEFGRLPSVDAKIAASRDAIENLHPGCGQHLRSPVYVSWGKIPYNQGSWVRGFSNPSSERGYYDAAYKDFIEPDGRIYFAGDHCSHLNAWMEGASLAAHRAVKMIAERARG